MRVGHPCRLDHGPVVRLSHPRNVLANGAGKKLHILRQISDELAKLVLVPMVDLRSIEPDLPRGRHRSPDKQPAKKVLFPPAEGPTTATASPGSTTRDTLRRTGRRSCGSR